MSMQGVIAGLCGLTVAMACGHRPAPEPATELARDSTCAQQDTGVDLGHDVSRGPRYRVDSSGQVETLPPVPAAGTDTARHGCPVVPDSSGDSAP